MFVEAAYYNHDRTIYVNELLTAAKMCAVIAAITIQTIY